jgi:alpha-L-fucosidase
MKIRLVIPALFIAVSAFSQNKQPKVYEPTWESLAIHKMPEWYDDAKIGLSKHWGVYSVPAWAPRVKGISYAEWYWNKMMDPKNPTYDYHRENLWR